MAGLPELQIVTKAKATSCTDLCSGGDRAFFNTLQEVMTGKKQTVKTGAELYKSLPKAPFPAYQGGEVADPQGLRRPTPAEFAKALYLNECTSCNMRAQVGEFSKFRLTPQFWIGSALLGVAVVFSVMKR